MTSVRRPRGKRESCGDETPHGRAYTTFVFGKDSGVRNWQSERTAQKRDHGKPIGAGPDHASFRERAEIGRPDPVRGGTTHDDIDHCHQDEQQGVDRAHPAQFRATLCLSLNKYVGRSERRQLSDRNRLSSFMVGHHRGRLRSGDRKSKRPAPRPSHLPGKRLNNVSGAVWRVRTTFLGAVRSLWGLSLSRLVGFGKWLPPTYVGARDHRPTAVSAPRFMLDGSSN